MPTHSFARRFCAICLCLLLVAGCSKKKVEPVPVAPPAASFTGPSFLRGTVGSLVRVRNFEPQLVTGYGLVILPAGSGTGSSQVPAFLRQRLINEMRRKGLGSSRLETRDMSPARVLADLDTAIVLVYGFVPPGAVPGSRFDVVVSALDTDTDTTSLAGGQLWTTDLAIGGANVANRFVKPIASANGPAYINPFDDRPEEERQYDYRRRALIVAGGKATTSRQTQLVLNQPSWSRSRLIADRINAHFGKTTDDLQIAEAKSDLLIDLNVPTRFASNPLELIELVVHMYVQTGGGFEVQQAKRLADYIRQSPEDKKLAYDVMRCWQAMGRSVVPVLRESYNDELMSLRLASLKAGAMLGDERAGRSLVELAGDPDPIVRILAVESLVHLPRNIQGVAALKRLLDDEDRSVRIAAYETLAANDDPILGRIPVQDSQGNVKYLIDRVPSSKPLVYVTPRNFPRVAVFEPNLAFQTPMLASLWQDKLLARVDGPDQLLEIYYKTPVGGESRQLKAEPNVATLTYLLGHEPGEGRPQEGLNLTFGQVADALHQFCSDGVIPAPIEVAESPLASLVNDTPAEDIEQRPEIAPQGQSEAVSEEITPAGRPETGFGGDS